MSILSIQSAVQRGFVGNTTASLAFSHLGLGCQAVDTVRLQHHPGHGSWVGERFGPAELTRRLDGLQPDDWQAVISGYLGDPANAAVVADAHKRFRQTGRPGFYLLDPVIGDQAEGVYVDAALPRAFSEILLPLADIVTPNLFELSLLSGLPTDDLPAVLGAASSLLDRGPKMVVATSAVAEPGRLGALLVTASGAWMADVPLRETRAKGAGDLFAALFAGHLLAGAAPPECLGLAVEGVDRALAATDATSLDLGLDPWPTVGGERARSFRLEGCVKP